MRLNYTVLYSDNADSYVVASRQGRSSEDGLHDDASVERGRVAALLEYGARLDRAAGGRGARHALQSRDRVEESLLRLSRAHARAFALSVHYVTLLCSPLCLQ